MLVDYLAEHERMLDRVLKQAEEDAQKPTLNAWTCEFCCNVSLKAREEFDFHDQGLNQLLSSVLVAREKIMALYRELAEHAEVESPRELLGNLFQLEEHEAMRLARDTGRMQAL